jgi:hypothetical protein
MAKIQLNPEALTRPAPARWRRFPGIGIPLILMGLVGLIFSAGALASAAGQSTPLEKGKNPVQQAMQTPVTNLPPLDRSQPQRVETFTFGLG